MNCPKCGREIRAVHRAVLHCETWEMVEGARGLELRFVKSEFKNVLRHPQCTNCGADVWEVLGEEGVE